MNGHEANALATNAHSGTIRAPAGGPGSDTHLSAGSPALEPLLSRQHKLEPVTHQEGEVSLPQQASLVALLAGRGRALTWRHAPVSLRSPAATARTGESWEPRAPV